MRKELLSAVVDREAHAWPKPRSVGQHGSSRYRPPHRSTPGHIRSWAISR